MHLMDFKFAKYDIEFVVKEIAILPDMPLNQGFEASLDFPHSFFCHGQNPAAHLCIHATGFKKDFHIFHIVFHRKSLDFA